MVNKGEYTKIVPFLGEYRVCKVCTKTMKTMHDNEGHGEDPDKE